MSVAIVILVLILAILMIGVVLIQKSKGGGLASNFAGSNQIMGVRRTNNFIEKATWWCAGLLVFFCILGTYSASDAISTGNTAHVEATAPEQTQGGNYDTKAPAAQAPAAKPAATPAPAPAPAAPAK